MKILVIGSGLSGCSIAKILNDRGHIVNIIEKESRIGGLCVTNVNKDGLKYEPFGARTFHSKNQQVIDFVKRFVYTSSSMVYGDFEKEAVDEEHPTNPKDVYGGVKLAGEHFVKAFCKRFNIDYCIISKSIFALFI